MKGLTVVADEKKQTLTIEIPMQIPPVPSKTGTTLLVASTRGGTETEVSVNGQSLYLNINAYIYPGPKAGGKAENKSEQTRQK